MSKFSPGPWKWEDGWLRDANGDACGTNNDALIAASPRLFAGLKEIRKNTFFMGIRSGNATCSMTPEAVQMLDDLIKDIEGEPIEDCNHDGPVLRSGDEHRAVDECSKCGAARVFVGSKVSDWTVWK